MAQQVLLIDDDEGYLLAARRLLEQAGYDVRTAGSAAEARGQLASEKPDLVLLDVIMPGEDGFTFAEKLAQDETIAGVPVVLVTSVADSAGHTLRAFEKGKGLTAADVLPKSDAHERLLECVASVLGRQQDSTAQNSNT